MSKQLLKIKNLKKVYYSKLDEIEAISDVSFDIFEGEFVSIVGPSGCGKSTLLNILTSMDTKTSGEIKLKDKTLNISALFIYIGFTPNTDFLTNTNIKLDNGYIIVNEKYETNINGVYASGDVIKKDIYQIINAASEGAEAAININEN